ncbi:MAG TPA: Crp/Fnr family transcriptional regulator [Chitinophagales bacterium]|nr:Crp/Fnr family transcriptional regulator [Chitinophagales bacterium]
MWYQQFKDYLRSTQLVTDEDCAFFEPYLKPKTYKAKELFVKEGSISHEIGFINKGAFRTYYIIDGKEINTCFFFENDFVVDYDSMLAQTPSKYYIEAIEDSEVMLFSATVLRDAYNKSHNWERFGRLMAEQTYRMSTERVESFLFMNGEERYLQLLEKQPTLFERVPLYHIASYLGIERETLSRLRRKIAQG